jgi:1,4-alpha-glucan branching enzyme
VLFGNQWLSPGKKLLFMGQEFGQGPEWNHDHQLEWAQHDRPDHAGVQRWVSALNAAYVNEPALHRKELDPAGFEWVVLDDGVNSVLVWLRLGLDDDRPVLCVQNLTPVPRPGYRIGVPLAGVWEVLLNSDDPVYGGSGAFSIETCRSETPGGHGREQSLLLDLPPLSVIALAPAG